MFRKWQMCYTNVWTKGHIEPKARRAVDSSKKRTKEFVLFAVKSKKGNKTNLFLRFLGEPTVRQSAFSFIWPLMWDIYPRFGINVANCLQLILSLTIIQTNSELNKYKPVHNRKSQNDSSIIMTQSLLYLFICLVLLYTVLTEFRANVWNSRHTSGQHYDLKSLCGIKGGLSDFLLKKC